MISLTNNLYNKRILTTCRVQNLRRLLQRELNDYLGLGSNEPGLQNKNDNWDICSSMSNAPSLLRYSTVEGIAAAAELFLLPLPLLCPCCCCPSPCPCSCCPRSPAAAPAGCCPLLPLRLPLSRSCCHHFFHCCLQLYTTVGIFPGDTYSTESHPNKTSIWKGELLRN